MLATRDKLHRTAGVEVRRGVVRRDNSVDLVLMTQRRVGEFKRLYGGILSKASVLSRYG